MRFKDVACPSDGRRDFAPLATLALFIQPATPACLATWVSKPHRTHCPPEHMQLPDFVALVAELGSSLRCREKVTEGPRTKVSELQQTLRVLTEHVDAASEADVGSPEWLHATAAVRADLTRAGEWNLGAADADVNAVMGVEDLRGSIITLVKGGKSSLALLRSAQVATPPPTAVVNRRAADHILTEEQMAMETARSFRTEITTLVSANRVAPELLEIIASTVLWDGGSPRISRALCRSVPNSFHYAMPRMARFTSSYANCRRGPESTKVKRSTWTPSSGSGRLRTTSGAPAKSSRSMGRRSSH